MKNQKGFTLIELLLVLAIIGIISAIAIPALLGQRSRARDKSSIANAQSITADMIASYDKAREAGTDVSTVALFIPAICGTAAAPLIPQYFTAKNPWGTTGATAGYAAVVAETKVDGGDMKTAAAVGKLGQVQLGYMPVAAGTPGLIAAAVYIDGTIKDSSGTATHQYVSVAGLD
jgi:prepilin-type N-terminal cleavage/methylation domain-containing protein